MSNAVVEVTKVVMRLVHRRHVRTRAAFDSQDLNHKIQSDTFQSHTTSPVPRLEPMNIWDISLWVTVVEGGQDVYNFSIGD